MEKKRTQKEIKRLERKELIRKYKEWRERINKRDVVCFVCGRDVFLDAHHIIPRDIKQLRHDDDNGILLCKRHHKFSNVISAHKNPLIFCTMLQRKRPEQIKRLLEKYEILKLETSYESFT